MDEIVSTILPFTVTWWPNQAANQDTNSKAVLILRG